MKSPLLWSVCIAFSASAAFGQSPNKPKDVDTQWRELLTMVATPPAAPASGGKKSRADVEKERNDQAQAARLVAKAAKDYYTANPSDVNAGEAKKLEALYGLKGVTEDDSAYEQAALATARVYRNDSRNPVTDRFDVAVSAERVSSRKKLKGTLDVQNVAELEKIGTGLRAEFGDRPEVFNFYASVARAADMTSAKRIATLITQSPANSEAKEEAQSILTRDTFIGKPLGAKLITIEGETIDLAQPSGKTTILYICNYGSGSSHSLAALRTFKNLLTNNVQVVYLMIGATPAQAQAVKSLAPTAGAFCVEAADDPSSVTRALQVRRAPFVFVANASGTLTGFGPVAETGNLVAAAH